MSAEINAHLDQSYILQFLDMAGERTAGDVQAGGNFVHVHFFVFEQKTDNIHPQFRSQRFEQLHSVFQILDIHHLRITPPHLF